MAVKNIWFLLSMVVYYKLITVLSGYDLFEDFSMIPDNYHKYLIPALFVFGAVFFMFYDHVMMRFQRVIDYLVEKIKF